MTIQHLQKQAITVQRRTDAVDASGGVSWSWAAHLTLTASVQPGTSEEAVRVGAERGRRTFDVYLDFGQDITAKDRILFGGDTLDIVGEPRDLSGRGMVTHIVAVETGGVTSG